MAARIAAAALVTVLASLTTSVPATAQDAKVEKTCFRTWRYRQEMLDLQKQIAAEQRVQSYILQELLGVQRAQRDMQAARGGAGAPAGVYAVPAPTSPYAVPAPTSPYAVPVPTSPYAVAPPTSPYQLQAPTNPYQIGVPGGNLIVPAPGGGLQTPSLVPLPSVEPATPIPAPQSYRRAAWTVLNKQRTR